MTVVAWKIFVQLIGWLVPSRLQNLLLRSLLGYQIDHSAKIGCSVILSKVVIIGPKCRIGHLTMIKGLDKVVLEAFALIGNGNWISGIPSGRPGPFSDEAHRAPTLQLGEHSAITHSHRIDCTNSVEIGSYATVAGWHTQILTHSINFKMNRQTSKPVIIGEYSFVGSRCVVLKGARLPAKSVLAAGSVLAHQYTDESVIFSGVPAIPIRGLEADGYFIRTIGEVL